MYPILFVPGVLGTTLVARGRPNRRVWGSARGLFALERLPITLDGVPQLEPREVLWHFAVVPGLYGVPIYEKIAARLEALDCRRAPLDAPAAVRGLYGLPYDWRGDAVAAARAIEDAVERLRTRLGVPRVHILAHSWGCNVVRYYLRYGGADVLADPAEPPRPGAPSVATFYALGPLFGGTLRALHEALRGFELSPIAPGVPPHHTAVTPSLYQLLPYGGPAALRDDGSALDLDLSDVAHWQRRGWGPFAAPVYQRLQRGARRAGAVFNDDALEERMTGWLYRGQQLWHLLETPHDADTRVRTVTYTVQDTPTLTRLVIDRHGVPMTCVDDVTRGAPRLIDAATAPGDGYVSFAQTRRHCPAPIVDDPGQALGGSYVLAVGGCSHRDICKDDRVLANLLHDLSTRAIRRAEPAGATA